MTPLKKDFDTIQKRLSLLDAIKANEAERVEELLKAGADPDTKDGRGCPALQYALPHPDIVTLLLDHGADVDGVFTRVQRRNNHIIGETPALVSAIIKGCTESARLLIERGADIEAKDISNAILLESTALMQAVNHGNKEIVELLLDKGARIDERDNTGASALWWAACKGDIPILQLLLDRGAALDLKDDAGYTPESIARREGHDQAVKLIKQAPADRRRKAEEKARAEAAAIVQKENDRRESVAARQKSLQEQARKLKMRQP